MFEAFGAAGIAISMLAYLPQVVHLAKVHCSAGVSSRAWTMWLFSSLLIGALAVHRRDAVFILLQISSLTAAAVILFLGHKYRGLGLEQNLNRPLALTHWLLCMGLASVVLWARRKSSSHGRFAAKPAAPTTGESLSRRFRGCRPPRGRPRP